MTVRTIRSPQLATYILKHGGRIERLKPDPGNNKKTFFVFWDPGNIQDLINEYVKLKGSDSHE